MTTPETVQSPQSPDTPTPVPEVQPLTERLTDALVDVLAQACGDREGRLDSYALSAYADAMRLLAELKVVRIESSAGRRILARLPHAISGRPETPDTE